MRTLTLSLFILAAALPAFAEPKWNPVADPKAVVVEGSARFTVLTPRLIRMEWAQIRLINMLPPQSVTGGSWRYDGPTLTTIISVPPHPVNQRVIVVVKGADAPPILVSGIRGELSRLRTAMEILDASWPDGWSPDIVIDAAQAGRRMTLRPSAARTELERLQGEMPAIVEAITRMEVDCRMTSTALNHLGRTANCVPAVK